MPWWAWFLLGGVCTVVVSVLAVVVLAFLWGDEDAIAWPRERGDE